MNKVLTAEMRQMWHITIKLFKTNYGGLATSFELRSANSIVPLEIKEVREHHDYFEYLTTYKDFDFGEDYTLYDNHGLTASIDFTLVAKDPQFIELFKYDGDDLGPTYQKEQTTFKVFAPSAPKMLLEIEINQVTTYHEMYRHQNGVFSLILKGDWELAKYRYMPYINGSYRYALDPYAYSSTPNHTKSVVIDLEKTNVQRFDNLPPLNQNVEAIIYELSIRDFSVDPSVPFVNRGKYIAFLEEGLKSKKGLPVGIDYLASLGVTHIQLLPFYDFGSVDELNQFNSYNWGYDPVQYGIPEGSYASNPSDPYSRVIECKQMIEKLHQKGLRVNMDTVFNHMFDRFTSAFENLCPYYYFKVDEHGNISNGSFCSNDFDTLPYMARKYVLDILSRWISFYNVDGFRFDLMGIIDVETINLSIEKAKSIKKDFMAYGEGWNMPTMMNDELKATQLNNYKMPLVGFFSDRFRDVIKGPTSDHEITHKGYATGNFAHLAVVKDVMKASCVPSGFDYAYLSANNVVNYVECHDNHTLFDKIIKCCPKDSVEIRQKRQRLINALVLLTPGIPFIHAGQEFLRTKNGDHNSYMSSDQVNKLDYQLMEKHIDCVNYLKRVIEFRKSTPLLNKYLRQDIEENVIVEFIDEVVLKITFSDQSDSITLYVNPKIVTVEIELEKPVKVLLNGQVKNETLSKLYLNPISLLVVKN